LEIHKLRYEQTVPPGVWDRHHRPHRPWKRPGRPPGRPFTDSGHNNLEISNRYVEFSR
jgi:hypothetical protein